MRTGVGNWDRQYEPLAKFIEDPEMRNHARRFVTEMLRLQKKREDALARRQAQRARRNSISAASSAASSTKSPVPDPSEAAKPNALGSQVRRERCSRAPLPSEGARPTRVVWPRYTREPLPRRRRRAEGAQLIAWERRGIPLCSARIATHLQRR